MPPAAPDVPPPGIDANSLSRAEQDALWGHLYPELKALARSRLRRSSDFTLLDTTALVNQSCLRMLESSGNPLEYRQRGSFFAYAAAAMRSVVVDLARERMTDRHGHGGLLRIDTQVIGSAANVEHDPLLVDTALTALRDREPRLAQVVEMRFFGGFTEAEIAEALDISERSVRRNWEKARVLMRMLLD